MSVCLRPDIQAILHRGMIHGVLNLARRPANFLRIPSLQSRIRAVESGETL